MPNPNRRDKKEILLPATPPCVGLKSDSAHLTRNHFTIVTRSEARASTESPAPSHRGVIGVFDPKDFLRSPAGMMRGSLPMRRGLCGGKMQDFRRSGLIQRIEQHFLGVSAAKEDRLIRPFGGEDGDHRHLLAAQ